MRSNPVPFAPIDARLYPLGVIMIAFTSLAPARALALLPEGGAAGEVTVALPSYRALVEERARLAEETPAGSPWAIAERTLELAFDRGVLSGQLAMSVDSRVRSAELPLVDAEASLAEVTVDGARAVASKSGRHYVASVAKPGRHDVRVRFARGRQESRFSRAFVLPLPPAAVTRVSLELPEPGLDVEIEGGVVLGTRATERGTHVDAVLDGRAALSVRWQRRIGAARSGTRSLEVESLVLASLAEEVVRTKTELRYRVTEGETDRVELEIPEHLEVTGVTGAAILQWYTEAPKKERGAKRLVVLLRHLVEDQVTVLVTAELPRVHEDSAELAFVSPLDATLREGWVAVEGRDGFEVKPKRIADADEVGTREVPAELTALSDKPLLFAYRHQSKLPALELQVAKNVQLELTQALIDDLQASTVLVEQGTEVTKVRLYVRNNTRQYLSLRLPEGAALTHALIDGVPFHPGVEHVEGGERLLVPLRQSEKLSDKRPRHHVVRPGQTLGEISLLYFGRSDRWSDLIAANPGLSGPSDLRVGQRLVVPAKAGGVALEESTFVLELAYKVKTSPLALAARHRVALPELDLPVMSATWHLYFPDAYEPLSFTSNLKQLTAVRYDPIRRFLQFIDDVGRIRGAWAGAGPEGGSYANILEVRKAIYQREQKREVTEALSAFPLVGERFRFSRVLLGDQQAYLELVYVKRSVLPFVQWTALLMIALLGLRAVRAVKRVGLSRAVLEEPVWTFGLASAISLFAAHYVLGVHRNMVLGLDLALLLLLAPRLVGAWSASRARREDVPEQAGADVLGLGRLLRARVLVKLGLAAIAIALTLTYPLLLSTFVLVVLLVLSFGTPSEARHA